MDENEKHEIEQPEQNVETAGISLSDTSPDNTTVELSDETAVESLATLREKKIDECLRAALANEDPLMAGVAMLNADLQFYAQEARRMIEPALKNASANAKEMMHLFPMLDIPLRLCRQSMQFSSFIERLKRQQASAEKVMAKSAMAAVQNGDA